MSPAVVEHPLVHDYLRRLDVACAALPAAQARELRDQIIAHLDEALGADAADDEVGAELARLGSPAALAAEAAGPVRPSAAARLRNRLSRLGWRARTLITVATVLIVALIVGAGVYLHSVTSAPSLLQTGIGTWWFAQDRNAKAVTTSAGDVTQITVPERWGQQQGIVVGIWNDSDWTQTILGPASSWTTFGTSPVLFAVGSGPDADQADWDPADGPARWNLPDSLPPHSLRLLRVLWTSDICNVPGGSTIISSVTVRVRIGLITRAEQINLNTDWAIGGTRTSSPAPFCG